MRRPAGSSSRSRASTGSSSGWCSGICGTMFALTITALNLLILLHHWQAQQQQQPQPPQQPPQEHVVTAAVTPPVTTVPERQLTEPRRPDAVATATSPQPPATRFTPSTAACRDGDIWCCHQGKMPTKSHFHFPVATDPQRWYESCKLAEAGPQVLLPRIMREITHPYDFIDGDVSFQFLHKQVDEFMTVKDGFTGRMRPGAYDASKPVAPAPMSYGQFYEKTPYTRREHMHRVPIVMSGFMKYSGHSKDFLRGRFIGFEGVGLRDILRLWDKQKAQIGMDERFILVTNLNENWGFLSSSFPGRTSAWGRVDFEKFPALQTFLDDPRLLLLAIGQHSNISHPKVLMLPRGLPDTGGFSNHAARMMYDTMRLTLEKNVTKTKLLFTVSSSFGNRKTIVQCVKNNLPPALFDASGGTGVALLSRKEYLLRAAGSRFALAPPGLGYDTFRLWELQTLGTIPIIEKKVGFDRTLYQMPALLVEDFAMVTTETLREAYIEAMYRADEFRYNRLKQSYWSDLLYRVSVEGTLDTLLTNHPMAAEDADLVRPLHVYHCEGWDVDLVDPEKAGQQGPAAPPAIRCGPGTKRPPRRICGINELLQRDKDKKNKGGGGDSNPFPTRK